MKNKFVKKYVFSIKNNFHFSMIYKDIHFDLFSIHWNHFGREFTIFGITFRWDREFLAKRVKDAE